MAIVATAFLWLRRLWGWLDTHREFLMVLAVAGVAAFLWFRLETTRGERDALLAWRSNACASADAAGTTSAECSKAIAQLAAFKRDTIASSNTLRTEAAQQHATKAADDIAAADRDRASAGAAKQDMEKANAAISSDDHVGGYWFAALNRTGGLRAPGR